MSEDEIFMDSTWEQEKDASVSSSHFVCPRAYIFI